MSYYKLQGRLVFQGLPISIENRKGSKRYWTDDSTGETGSTTMRYPYGYIKGTLGTDGDEVDVYVGPCKESLKVFVVTQNQKPAEGMAGSKPWVVVDEQKVMLGFTSAKEAQEAYLAHYDDPRFFGYMTELRMCDFKDRLQSHKGKLIKGFISGAVAKVRSMVAKVTQRKTPGEKAADKYFKDLPSKYTNKIDDDGDGEVDRFYNAAKRWNNDNAASKSLKDEQTAAILTEDITHMLILSKSNAQKAFKPVVEAEEQAPMNKAKLVDTAEEEAQKALTSELKANAKDEDGDGVPTGLDKDPDDAGPRKAEIKKTSLGKSLRDEAIAILKAGFTPTVPAEVRPAVQAVTVVETFGDKVSRDLGVDINKALRAIAVTGMSKRARMDAAFQLGRAMGHTQPVLHTEPVSISVNVGTAAPRSSYEPPVVPLRRVVPPQPADPVQVRHRSCVTHGYVHKSDSPCPLCASALVAESGPLWGQ